MVHSSSGLVPFKTSCSLSNRGTDERRVRPTGTDKIQEIVASEHFNELLWQFQCLDECKCDCVFGRSVRIPSCIASWT